MLQGMTVALPPAFRISAAASSQTGALRDDTTTLAPDSARCRAIALPMPLLEPVTTATLPVRSKSGDAMDLFLRILGYLRTIVAAQEGRIRIVAEPRACRHVDERLPGGHADAVDVAAVARLDGREVILFLRRRQQMQRGQRRRPDERRMRRRGLAR